MVTSHPKLVIAAVRHCQGSNFSARGLKSAPERSNLIIFEISLNVMRKYFAYGGVGVKMAWNQPLKPSPARNPCTAPYCTWQAEPLIFTATHQIFDLWPGPSFDLDPDLWPFDRIRTIICMRPLIWVETPLMGNDSYCSLPSPKYRLLRAIMA